MGSCPICRPLGRKKVCSRGPLVAGTSNIFFPGTRKTLLGRLVPTGRQVQPILRRVTHLAYAYTLRPVVPSSCRAGSVSDFRNLSLRFRVPPGPLRFAYSLTVPLERQVAASVRTLARNTHIHDIAGCTVGRINNSTFHPTGCS